MVSTNINIRTNTELKENAKKVFAAMGLDLSSGVNLLLTQVVNRNALPFEVIGKNSNDISDFFGCLKGKTWIADDFDEPLEDFKDYM